MKPAQTKPQMQFNQLIKNRRQELGYTLRKFCEAKGYDPSYISRIENGLLNPPTDQEKLRGLAIALEYEDGTPDWVHFFDSAAAYKYEFPSDIKENFPKVVEFLPAFYRAVRKEKVTETDIKTLLNTLRQDQ